MGMIAKKEFYILGVVLIVVVAFAVGLPLMLTGQTVTIGEHPESEAADAVTCGVYNMRYTVFSVMSGELGTDMNIKMMFEHDKLETLGLYYTATYDSESNALTAYNTAQAEMNIKMNEAGVEQNVLNANFSVNGVEMRMNLYIKGDNMGKKVLPFLMLSSELEAKNNYIRSYEAIGMGCN